MIKEFRAYQAGAIARKKGVVVGDNPHDEKSKEFWRWMQGWLNGVAPKNKQEKTNASI